MTHRLRSKVLLTIVFLLSAPFVFAYDEYIEPGGTVDHALALRMTSTGLEFIGNAAEDVVNGMDIEGMMMEENPVYNEGACGGDVEMNITGVSWGSIDVDIATEPFPGQSNIPRALYGRLLINDLNVDVNVDLDDVCLISMDIDATATVDEVKGLMAILIVYTETEEGPKLGIELSSFISSVSGLELDLGLPSILEFLLSPLVGIVESVLEGMVEDEIPGLIQPLLDEYLNQSFPLSGEFPIEMINSSLLYNMEINSLLLNNGATIDMEGYIYIDGFQEGCADIETYPGSRLTDNSLPSFSLLTPNGLPYHVGVVLSDDILNQVAYSTYYSGLLCQTLDESILPFGYLSVNHFGRIAPSMARNLGEIPPLNAADEGEEEPQEGDSVFALMPHEPPIIDIGNGDPDLLVLSLEDFEFGMYEFLDERWIRTLGISLSLEIGVGVELSEGLLSIIIEDPQIEFDLVYSEYSGMDETQVQSLLDTILAVVWPMLEDAIGEGFELPAIEMPSGHTLGYDLAYAGPDGQMEDFLGVYIALSLEEPVDAPETFVVLTSARTGRTDSYELAELNAQASADYGLSDSLDLAVAFEAVGAGGDAEFSYRLDDGFWSRYSPEPYAMLPLVLEGRHVLEVRARNAEGSYDKTPARLEFVADGVAPSVLSVSLAEDLKTNSSTQVNVQAYDWQTQPEEILYSIRIDDGDFGNYVSAEELQVGGLKAGKHVLSVRAIDLAGNESETVETSFTVKSAGSGGSAGCGLAGSAGGLALPLLVFGTLLLGWRRHR